MKITVNSDKKFVEELRKAIQENDGYCPCAVLKTQDTKCMCKEFVEQTHSGPCHCGLYTKTLDEDEKLKHD